MRLHNFHKIARGFTLVEMAVVLLIIGLLLGGLLAPLSNKVEQERREVTQSAMQAAEEALIGYALSTGRLPCPDIDIPSDGQENAGAGGACDQVAGTLPWVDLDIQGEDAWGRDFGYAVSGVFASSVAPFTLDTDGTLQVYDNAASACGGATGQMAVNIPAMLYSNAKNDFGTTDASADELENSDNDNCFVSRGYNIAGGSEFDDLVSWVSPNILFNRMVAAERLP